MNPLLSGLLAVSVILIQCLIGGTRLVHAFPTYGIIALVSIGSIAFFRRESGKASLVSLITTAGFFTYMLLRAARSPWDYLWWQDFYQMIACLMVYYLFVLYFWQPKSRMVFIGLLFAFATVEFFIGLRQFRYGDNWMPFGFIRGDNGLRASGTLISPIHYAGFLEVIGAFALAVACWSRWPGWARALVGYAAVLCYAGVAISGSRGAWIASIFSLIVFGALSLLAVRRTRPENVGRVFGYGAIITGFVLVGGVVLMLQNPLLQKRLDTLSYQDSRVLSFILSDGTSQQTAPPGVDVRVYNWKAALDQIKHSPVFGTGAGTHLYYGRLFRRPQIQADPIHAHSDYLEISAEYGLIGLGGILLLIAAHAVHGFRRLSHVLRTELGDLDYYQPARSDQLALSIGALTALSVYLAHSVVDFNLHIPGNALTFAFVFAILASPGLREPAPVGPVESAFRVGLPALGVWMAAIGLPKYPGEYWCEQARIALRDGRRTEAIELANRAIGYEKRNFELYFHLGEAERTLALTSVIGERKGHFEKAVAAYRQALAIFPGDEHVLVRLAQTLDELGRFAESGALYREAISHDPNLGALYAYYAKHLFRVGRFDEAHEQFAKSAKLGTMNRHLIVDPSFTDTPAEPAVPPQAP